MRLVHLSSEQDCHTTNSMHGNGNIGTTTLAGVEVECADCHETPLPPEKQKRKRVLNI